MSETPRQAPLVSDYRRRRMWWAIIIGSTCLFTAWLALRFFANPERVRSLAQSYLQQYLNGSVTIGSASISWFDGVSLRDVAVAAPAVHTGDPRDSESGLEANAARPVFSCRKVDLTFDLGSLFVGDLQIDSVVALSPTLTIVRDKASGRTNLTGLFRGIKLEEARATKLPLIELKNARVEVLSWEDGTERFADGLSLTIRARPLKRDGYIYDIVWREDGPDTVASGHSQIDLTTGLIENRSGGLPWMSIEAVMLALNARFDGAGAWCDLLGLGGKVRAKDYLVRDTTDSPSLQSATVELRNANMSIPIDEHERGLVPDKRYLRFRQVNGEVRLEADGIRAEFTGQFHGAHCTVSAHFRGGVEGLTTLDDVDLDATITVKGLTLPRIDEHGSESERYFVNHWPQLVRFYHDYDPHGKVDIEIEVGKIAGRGESFGVRRAVLTARGGDAASKFFPYRGFELTGTVEYTSQGVYIRNLTGTSGDGTISVNGHCDRPTRESAKVITIRGENIQLDQTLNAALPPKFLRIQELFQPVGAIDLDINLTQAPCTKGEKPQWTRTIEIGLRNVAARYEMFPYLVDGLDGIIRTDGRSFELVGVSGRHGEGSVTVDGRVHVEQGRVTDLDLLIQANQLSFDADVLAALPAAMQSQLASLHASGKFDARVRLDIESAEQKIGYDAVLSFERAFVQHDAFPLAVREVKGKVRVTPDKFFLDNLSGRYEDAVIHASGFIQRADGMVTSVDLAVHTEGFQINSALLADLPEGLRNQIGSWRVDGAMTTDTRLVGSTVTQAGVSVVTQLALRDASVSHPFFPAPLQHVNAFVTFDESGIRASGIVADYGSGRVKADIDIKNHEGGEHGVLSITATNLALDESLRDMLSPQWASTVADLAPSGWIDVYLERLEFTRPSPEARRVWEVTGYVELDDVLFAGSSAIRGLSGTILASGYLIDQEGGTALTGGLAFPVMDVFGHRVARTEGAWAYARAQDGGAGFSISNVHASIYGGSITGELEARFGIEDSDYDLSLTVYNMELEEFLNAERTFRGDGEEPVDVSGLVDGHVYVSAKMGQVDTRRGGGRFEVRKGRFYRLPLFLAILHVLNLEVPPEKAFEAAQGEFFLLGNRVQLRDIVLKGSALTLVGYGSMTLPDRGVDLSFVHVVGGPWAKVPILSELLRGASRELIELHVVGPMSRPRVRAKPFRGIREEFQRLFQKRESSKIAPASP